MLLESPCGAGMSTKLGWLSVGAPDDGDASGRAIARAAKTSSRATAMPRRRNLHVLLVLLRAWWRRADDMARWERCGTMGVKLGQARLAQLGGQWATHSPTKLAQQRHQTAKPSIYMIPYFSSKSRPLNSIHAVLAGRFQAKLENPLNPARILSKLRKISSPELRFVFGDAACLWHRAR